MAAVALGLAVSGIATADFVTGDADTVRPGIQTLVDLGSVAAGSTHEVDVGLLLECRGTAHLDRGSSVTLTPVSPGSAPSGGSIAGTTATVGPVPAGWPADGTSCPPDGLFLEGGTSRVTIVAPPNVGTGYTYRLDFSRSTTDGIPASSTTFVTFRLSVTSVNTPPVLHGPADLTVEADTAGGWTAGFTVTASDAEDDPDPVPDCDPAPGALLPLGTTTVTCTASDSAGAAAELAFDVTVVDTTPPTLAGLPTGIELTTTDPSGAVLAYDLPSATDVADPAPAVACLPAPGALAPVGAAWVTCTATDAAGNESSGSFPVRVGLWSAAWDEPVSAGDPGLAVNGGRSIPLKVRLWLDGIEARAGDAWARVVDCATGSAPRFVPMAWSPGPERWTGKLDTASLSPGCHRVEVLVDGALAGAFRLQVASGESGLRAR